MTDPKLPHTEILSKKPIYACPWFSLDMLRIRRPDGTEADHHALDYHKQAVGVVPVTDDGRILLARIFRFIPGRMFWETPAGGIEEAETPEDAAHRELLEETGYEAESISPLYLASAESGISDHAAHTFIAHGIRKVRDRFDNNEICEIKLFEMPEILTMMSDGTVNEIFTMLNLLYYNTYPLAGITSPPGRGRPPEAGG